MDNINRLEVTQEMDEASKTASKLSNKNEAEQIHFPNLTQHATVQVSTPWPPMLNAQVERSSGAISKTRPNHQQLHKADDAEAAGESCEMQNENFSISQLPVIFSELDAPTRETGEKEKKKYQTPGELPPHSLPSPKENAIKNTAKVDINRYIQLSSSEYRSPPSLALEIKNQPGPCQNAVPNQICKAVHSSDGQQSKYTPSRPASPEAAHSLQNPTTIVTGLGYTRQNSSMAIVCQTKGKSLESGSPTEHGDFAVEMQKAKCALLEAEYERRTREMYISKEQECKKLDEELNSATGQVKELKLQMQKLQEEHEQLRLDSERRIAEVFGECRNAVQKVKNMNIKLAKETNKTKRMKRQLAKERSKRMRMELELASEKRKRKRMEKRKKKVCKENDSLHRNVSFLAQELRERTAQLGNSQAQLENSWTQYYNLQQDLEAFKDDMFAKLRVATSTSEEYRRRFEENTGFLAESHELCRKATQMYHWEVQKCERLGELIQQHGQQYDDAVREIENLKRESQEVSQEFHTVIGQVVEELRLENEQKLQEELERRMGEVSQAFLTAETDQMKIMKLKLVKEANKLKKIKGQLARERSKRKMILKLANQRRKKKRIKKRNKKSHVCKCAKKRGGQGGGGGGNDDDDDKDDGSGGGGSDDDDDVDDDYDPSQSGGTYGGHESHDDGELSSTALMTMSC